MIENKEKNIMANRPMTTNHTRRKFIKKLSSRNSAKHIDYSNDRSQRVKTEMGSRNHNFSSNQFEKSIG
jgi:hypothetical protein